MNDLKSILKCECQSFKRHNMEECLFLFEERFVDRSGRVNISSSKKVARIRAMTINEEVRIIKKNKTVYKLKHHGRVERT